MGFLDAVGHVVKAVGDDIGDGLDHAANWVGDRVDDAGKGIGDFFSGNVGAQAQAAPDFVPKILASKGAPDWHDGAQTATQLASAHADVSSQVQRMSSGLESVWTGSASEAAQARIKPLADVANAASETFTTNAQNLTGLAHGFESMKQSLTPMPSTPPHKNFGDVVSLWDTDTEKEINQYNQDAQRNIERYTAYSQQAQAVGQALKIDYGQIGDFNSGDISLSKPATPPPGPGPSHPPTGGHVDTYGLGGPTHDPGQPSPGQQGPPTPVVPPGQHVPVGHSGVPPQGSGTEPIGTTHVSSYLPPAPQGTGSTVPPVDFSGGGGGSSSGAGGVGSFAGGSFGSGGGAGGAGSIGSRLSGGNASGAGAVEEGAGRGPGGSGSAGGAAGGRGAPGMGGGAGGKGKGKEDDKEHVRKYGLTDDSAFTLADENGEVLIDPSTGMAVVPPTIGG